MAPTIKWQRWSANYDWLSSDPAAALPQITTELQAWVTAVNANPSNVGRQVAIERDYTDSTSTNYKGFTISAADSSNTSKGYLQYISSSTSSKRVYVGNAWDGGTGNGGYGTVSGGQSDTSVAWLLTGTADFLLCSDTTDGQEFFTFGPRVSGTNTAYMDGFSIIKCADGAWALTTGDGNSAILEMHYFNDVLGTGWSSANRTSDAGKPIPSENATYFKWGMISDSGGSNSADPVTDGVKAYYAANPALLSPTSNSTYGQTGGRRIMDGLGTFGEVYVLAPYFYGPGILVDLRY